jgi:hypothetical protein
LLQSTSSQSVADEINRRRNQTRPKRGFSIATFVATPNAPRLITRAARQIHSLQRAHRNEQRYT